MNLKIMGTIVVMGMLMALPFLASAQDSQADNMQIFFEELRDGKKSLVAENIQLSPGEAKNFWPLYDQYQNELFLLKARTLNLIKDYGEAYEQMTDETAKKLLNEYLTVETLRLKLREAYLPKFRKILPDTKVLRYYQIENKVNAVLVYQLASKIPFTKDAK